MTLALMPLWPAGFMQTPERKSWEGQPFDTRASFDPETGPPLLRSRTTAEAWTFSA